MGKCVAFLRAINVGGRTVTMERLRGLFGAMGMADVETFIASGNVVFASPPGKLVTLPQRIEDHLRASLGYEVKTFVRTDAEVAAIAQHRAFSQSQLQSAVSLNVGFVAEPLDAGARKRLMALETDIDDFHVHNREVYWLCRKRQSDSTFSNVAFEKAVGVRVTFRGLNTIARLTAKYAFGRS